MYREGLYIFEKKINFLKVEEVCVWGAFARTPPPPRKNS